MRTAKIGRVEMPVVQSSFKKYESSRRVRTGVFWGTLNLVVVVFAISEILYGSVFQDVHVQYPVVWYAELVLAVWCSLRLLSEIIFFLTWLIENPVILTPKQYQLLAIHPKDKRFTSLKNKPFQDSDHLQPGSTPKTPGLSPVVPISSPSRVPTPGSQRSSPMMAMSSFSSVYMTPYCISGSHYSPSYQDMPTQIYQSPPLVNTALRNRFIANADSPYSPTKFSPVCYNDITLSPDTSVMPKYPSPSTSPFSDDRIKNVNALNSYLQTQEDKSEMLHQDGYASLSGTSGFSNNPTSFGSNQWPPYSSYMEYSTPLSVYKIGTRSPLASASKDEDEFGHMSPQAEEMIDVGEFVMYMSPNLNKNLTLLWSKFGASRQDLDLWTENLRKWISQTVMCKLVKQIDEINASLRRIGSSELQIGTISVGSLRQVSISKAEHVPTLAAVLPYLELSINQEYLVKRIKELGQDSCMGVYRWKFGSDYRGRRWDQDLPTDAQIVMHVFCTYMDSRLPTDARFPDGRTFTGLYFLKNLDKLECKRRDLAIHRFRQNPPHFKVIVGDDVYDVGKGRNNLFHSIILFLFMVKTKQHGMLGRVSLGPSGVNILGIFTKR